MKYGTNNLITRNTTQNISQRTYMEAESNGN